MVLLMGSTLLALTGLDYSSGGCGRHREVMSSPINENPPSQREWKFLFFDKKNWRVAYISNHQRGRYRWKSSLVMTHHAIASKVSFKTIGSSYCLFPSLSPFSSLYSFFLIHSSLPSPFHFFLHRFLPFLTAQMIVSTLPSLH